MAYNQIIMLHLDNLKPHIAIKNIQKNYHNKIDHFKTSTWHDHWKKIDLIMIP